MNCNVEYFSWLHPSIDDAIKQNMTSDTKDKQEAAVATPVMQIIGTLYRSGNLCPNCPSQSYMEISEDLRGGPFSGSGWRNLIS